MKKFEVNEIKAGFVLELVEDGKRTLASVNYNNMNELCVSDGESVWFPVRMLNDDLTYSGVKVSKVYGRTYSHYINDITTENRNLIWSNNPNDEDGIGVNNAPTLDEKKAEVVESLKVIDKQLETADGEERVFLSLLKIMGEFALDCCEDETESDESDD